MTKRKALGWRVAVGAAALGAAVLVQQSCLKKVDQPESALNAAQVDKVQSVIRVFRKLIGRDPGQAEIAALKSLAYPELVNAVLTSAQFDEEGFYNLQRERLLLNREGTQGWVRQSYDDYCALRLEFAEQAGADRAGDYWQLLRYRDRWVPIAETGVNGCFFGTDVQSLVDAKLNPPTGTLTERQKLAKRCVQSLQYSLPVATGEDPEQKLKELVEKLKALPEEQRKQSFLATPEGEALFARVVKQNVFPEFTELPATATPAKDLTVELVKKDGKPAVVQELGTAGNQQCLFTTLDPAQWVPRKPGGGIDPDDNGGGGPVVLPPIDFPSPVGMPDQPVLFATPAAAASNAAVADALAKADGTIYVKMRFPVQHSGVHASPYWLSRHPSKPRNRDLHRARVVYYSYFCTDINPDAANFVGAPITEFPETLRPYFAPDDNHVKGSQNCYNCHTKVQPLANFFGLLSWGTPYDPGGGDGGFGGGFQRWPQYLPDQGGFDRPGGIYDGTKFFEGGANKGMEGLASHLAKYPQVNRCMAEATWAALVGREFPLFEDERAAAIKAFEGTGGKASLSRLVKHYLTENPRGQALFTKGEAEFAKMKPAGEFTCPDTVTDEIKDKALATMSDTCADCHEGAFMNADKKFDVDLYFTENGAGVEDTPKNRGNLWHKLFCKVKLEKMPPSGSGAQLDKATRGALWCYFGRTRDKLAADGQIPAEFKDKVCTGAPPASSSLGGPHPMPSGMN